MLWSRRPLAELADAQSQTSAPEERLQVAGIVAKLVAPSSWRVAVSTARQGVRASRRPRPSRLWGRRACSHRGSSDKAAGVPHLGSRRSGFACASAAVDASRVFLSRLASNLTSWLVGDEREQVRSMASAPYLSMRAMGSTPLGSRRRGCGGVPPQLARWPSPEVVHPKR